MHKSFEPTVAGWTVRVVPAGTEGQENLFSCWDQVLSIANGSLDGAHILAYHKREEGRARFEREVYGHHRLLWLELADLKLYGYAQFNDRIREIAEFESRWRDKIRPSRLASPLILPERSFEPNKYLEQMWKQCQFVQIGRYDLQEVCRLRDRFDREHRDDGEWIDSRDRRFQHKHAPRHADHRVPIRHWKYTFRVEVGFHFDVDCRHHGTSILIRGTDGQWQHIEIGSHGNVDCHGYLSH